MDKNYSNRKTLLPIISRLTPVIYPLLLLIYLLVIEQHKIWFTIILIIVFTFSNNIFKYIIAKPIYNLFPNLNNYIQGTRPVNAKGCGLILNNIMATKSFGLPSGHSQIVWCITTYIILKKIYFKYYNSDEDINIYDIITICISVLLLIYSVYVSYSRVYIEKCHTLAQVIIGGFIGIIIACIFFYIEMKYKL